MRAKLIGYAEKCEVIIDQRETIFRHTEITDVWNNRADENPPPRLRALLGKHLVFFLLRGSWICELYRHANGNRVAF